MKKLISILAVLSILALGTSAVFADSPGQLATGPNVYEVKDVTSGGSYTGIINSVACNDVVQFSTELNNGGFGGLTNIVLKASLPGSSSTTVTSTVTATPGEGSSFGTTGTVTINSSSVVGLSYVSGSTKLYGSNGSLISTLPDSITTNGVNVGNLAGSTTEFVNFQAKVTCAPTPTPPQTPSTPAKPVAKALPNTGAGDVAELFVGTSAFGTLGHYFISRRRR